MYDKMQSLIFMAHANERIMPVVNAERFDR